MFGLVESRRKEKRGKKSGEQLFVPLFGIQIKRGRRKSSSGSHAKTPFPSNWKENKQKGISVGYKTKIPRMVPFWCKLRVFFGYLFY